jgi:UDP-glucose 4-epimerase
VPTILVTGGAGYIGSHTVVSLLEAGMRVVVLDNLCNSKKTVLERIARITGKFFDFVEGDIRDRNILKKIFNQQEIGAVMHFAALKSVSESEKTPIKYYDNNVTGSLILFEEMVRANISVLIFSSSASVYGHSEAVQYREDHPLMPVNVYGRTKLIIEQFLQDFQKAQTQWSIASLRYFNAVGAHESGLIGEDPFEVPHNLMPFIGQVATGQRDKLFIFGNDYPTPDGTALRDYIHVEDLAAGHLAALRILLEKKINYLTVNLGTGRPYSVLELVHAYEKTSLKKIPFETVNRRPGDLPEYYADPTRAKQLLGWQAHHDINRICQDHWRWQSQSV